MRSTHCPDEAGKPEDCERNAQFCESESESETANITKTVTAATRQIEDIIYIRDHYGLENLPEALSQMAEVRLENPDAPLKELGEYLDPPVGKSGVNHRLRKLSELAERIRT